MRISRAATKTTKANIDVRHASDRLEETIFHESVHTSLDATYSYLRSPEWLEAQEADDRFLTEYARENPDSEELAESSLYALGVTHYPERFPPELRAEIEERIPNRIAFLDPLWPADQPLFIAEVDPTCE